MPREVSRRLAANASERRDATLCLCCSACTAVLSVKEHALKLGDLYEDIDYLEDQNLLFDAPVTTSLPDMRDGEAHSTHSTPSVAGVYVQSLSKMQERIVAKDARIKELEENLKTEVAEKTRLQGMVDRLEGSLDVYKEMLAKKT